MIETLLVCVNVLFIVAIWHFGWRRSALDDCRDRLHMLRESVRDHFIDTELGLEHPAYRVLRDMLNGYLFFSYRANLIEIFWFSTFMRRNPQVACNISKSVHAKYQNFDPHVRKFVTSIRTQAANAMVEYMLKTSAIAALLVFIASPVFGIIGIVRDARKVLGHMGNLKWIWEAVCLVFKRVVQLLGAAILTGHTQGRKVSSTVTDIMEECSNRYVLSESMCPA